jgi:hypothetical protein
MILSRFLRHCAALLVAGCLLAPAAALAWGREGHFYINRAAARALPTDMPAFMRTPEAVRMITYFGPEPDRWNSLGELNESLRPEHYVLLELADVAGAFPATRLEYIQKLTEAQRAHPDQAADFTPYHVGLQPYSALEVYGRLLAAMREYRRLSAAHEDTKPVKAGILLYAGWLGHYVGDGANPMHTSVNYNGWVQANPDGFTGTGHDVHGEWENVFLAAHVKQNDFADRMTPPHPLHHVFTDYVAYLRSSNALVHKTYAIQKAGGFRDVGSPEALKFTYDRMAAGASMLRDMIYSAWLESSSPPVKPASAK